MTDATTTTAARPVERRYDRPKVPHTIHLREFKLPDGRPLLVDRRALAFIVPAADKPDKNTIMAFRTQAKACPVACPYETVKAWWFGTVPAGSAKAA
jgi:hypothetical protein